MIETVFIILMCFACVLCILAMIIIIIDLYDNSFYKKKEQKSKKIQNKK